MLTGVRRITCAVYENSIDHWEKFWQALGGVPNKGLEYGSLHGGSAGIIRRAFDFNSGEFEIVLLAPIDPACKMNLSAHIKQHGDHSVFRISFGVAPAHHFLATRQNRAQAGFLTTDDIGYVIDEKDTKTPVIQTALIKRIDHLTFVETMDTIESAKDFWVGLGGKLRKQINDVRVNDPLDSMMLWEVIFNEGIPRNEFFIALVAGIDRREQSQVNKFLDRNGLHALQHVAYDVGDMDKFRPYFERELGGNLLSDTLLIPDDFGGFTEQVFGWGYDGTADIAEREFPEFLARRKQAVQVVQVREKAGIDLHEVVRNASKSGERKPLVDFARLLAT